MAKYLDETGLGTLWANIKTNFYSTKDLSFTYDSDGKKIKLIGKDPETPIGEIDATPFIKDGMLEDVNIIDVIAQPGDTGKYGYQPDEGEFIVLDGVTEAGKYIIFQWNTDGDKKLDLIKASEIGATYAAGEAITISPDNKIDVEVDPVEGNAIVKSDSGIKVTEMKTSATKTTTKIPVAGGPLAELVSSVYPDGIPANTDMQTLLMNLFTKELYPDASVSEGTLNSVFDNPSININKSGTVEVGTQVTVPDFVGYNPKSTKKGRTYTGFTYGWSSADDDSIDQAGNPPTVDVTSVLLNSGDITIKRTYTKFGKNNDSSTQTGANSAPESVSIAGETATVEEGANSVKFEISGPGYKGQVAESPEYYIVSNLGNTDAGKKVANQPLKELNNASATAGQVTRSVTGNYKYFFGYTTKTTADSMTSDEIRALNGVASNWINPSSTTTIFGSSGIKSDGTSIVLACQEAYELKTVSDKLGNDMKGTFNNIATVAVKLAGTEKTANYTVYMYPITSGTQMELKDMTIGKK